MYIDFKELSTNGIELELLIQEILRLEGLDVHWEGAGSDNGKDLVIFEEVSGKIGSYRHKWVVQCKHTAHGGKALSAKENLNILDTCSMVNADGYLLICTTYLSSRLIEKIDSIQSNHQITIKYWDAVEIENRLLKPSCFSLIDRFFPESSARMGIRIYNSTHPAKWLATYKAHLLYLSSRISNLFPPVSMVEMILDVTDTFYACFNAEKDVFVKVIRDEAGRYVDWVNMELGDVEDCTDETQGFVKHINEEFIKVRSIFHDDKNNGYLVYVNYLYDGDKPLIPLSQFKSYFRSYDYVDGNSVEWEFGVNRADFGSERFNPNKSDYYVDEGHFSFGTTADFEFNTYDDRAKSFDDLLKRK